MGPSSTKGAMIPLARRPATTVVVFDGRGHPVAKGRGIDQALAPGAPAVEAGHRCGRGGLVDEDEALPIHVALPHPPAAPVPGHVGPILLGRSQALFYATGPSDAACRRWWTAPSRRSRGPQAPP